MKVLYPLSRFIAGFDFFPWLVMQAAGGATEVVFDIRNPKDVNRRWPKAKVDERIRSILLPGPALAGLQATLGTEGEQCGGYSARDLCTLLANGGTFPRLKSVLPAGKERYTVTLRKDARIPHRDSDEDAWLTFAKEIGAYVIPDYEELPIHLHTRMALYAGAEMNFFVTNGPVMLCFLSEYPAMGFDVNISPMVSQGIPYGESYPWLLPDRHVQVYETATLPVIRKHFEEWLKRRWV